MEIVSMQDSGDVKALFSQRLLAFLVDVIIVSFIGSLITSFIPTNSNISKLYDEQDAILENYVQEKISMEEYVNQIIDIEYDIAKYTVVISIVVVMINLLYYVVYPCYNNGQTFGKKLMKIRVKKVTSSDLTMNDLLIRSMINNDIFLNIICIALVLFLGKDAYLFTTSLFSSLQYLIMFISIIMIAFSSTGQGLHDKLVKTVVVRCN